MRTPIITREQVLLFEQAIREGSLRLRVNRKWFEIEGAGIGRTDKGKPCLRFFFVTTGITGYIVIEFFRQMGALNELIYQRNLGPEYGRPTSPFHTWYFIYELSIHTPWAFDLLAKAVRKGFDQKKYRSLKKFYGIVERKPKRR